QAILREYGRHSGVRRGCGVILWSSTMVGGKLVSPSIKRQGGDCWELPLNWIEMQENRFGAGGCAGRSTPLRQAQLLKQDGGLFANCCAGRGLACAGRSAQSYKWVYAFSAT
ncbi:hypothetical protein A2U01_0059124, partial [Trifolium medium]|nr:hypothetical protein [Trifolium medium]